MKNKIEIVIPVLNEELTLALQIKKLNSYLFNNKISAQITIADNGSIDNTVKIIEELKQTYKNINHISVNMIGVGRAIKAAVTKSNNDLFCFMDLDFSTNLNHINEAIKIFKNKNIDCVYGSRLNSNSKVLNRSFIRTMTSKIYNYILRKFFDIDSTDAACGFKFFTKEYFNVINKYSVSDGWFFTSELVIIGKVLNYNLIELPVLWKDDPNSKVKLLKLSIEYLKNIFALKRLLQDD
jgi:glycosyltransferase involved in cell wall biosynthesis